MIKVQKTKYPTVRQIYDYLSCGNEFQKHVLQCKHVIIFG